MKIYSLRGYIKKTMDEHSGGMKFTELLADVLCAWYEKHIDYQDALTPEIILAYAKKDFKILRYDWRGREKIFVYNRER